MALRCHYTLHFDSIKFPARSFGVLPVVLSDWCVLKRFPVVFIARAGPLGDEALAETGILRNSGHAGMEGVLHRACRGRTLCNGSNRRNRFICCAIGLLCLYTIEHD